MDAFLKSIKEIYGFMVKSYSEITVKNVIDILLVTIVLYLAFKFIRDRRAGKLILGILVLAIIEVFCEYFNMSAMKYILRVVFENGVLAMVIIFQPELRSILEVVADPLKNLRFSLGESKDQSDTRILIEAIRDSCIQMAKEKTGALIVIERDTKLGEISANGTEIDAKPSERLIRNLFYKGSPMHDGAVIIRHNRVASAGCYLPLTQKTDIDMSLGTRHRAAIGLSETSDAIVIVVSEETGIISIVSNCKITRNYDYNTLQNYLSEVFEKQKKKKKKKDSAENSAEDRSTKGE